MRDYKRIKDPVYGYINVPAQYITEIIDKNVFQRLRRIIQTSYSPLYSSALHNRFVHSLGVFHLGVLVAKQLENELRDEGFDKRNYGKIFTLACLLHDVGHAPFSHSGENFFLDDDFSYTTIHDKLIKAVGSKDFEADIPNGSSKSAAPHEIMSAIIGIFYFGDSFFKNTEYKEFFARCITGYKYKSKSRENSIKNCYISMLNSNIIDVDKLDYLVRDSYVTGFYTVNIDYDRLISSLTLVETEDNEFQVGYYKNAISVIENVVYAHDAERKWIQTHPTVLYETYIVQHIISHLSKELNCEGKKLFSFEALSPEGVKFRENLSVSLLCDDDIIYLAKNIFPNDLTNELFERKNRRHPLWKSESEYKAFILGLVGKGAYLETFEKAMDLTATYLSKSTDLGVINSDVIQTVISEKEKIEKLEFEGDAETKKVQIRDKTLILNVMEILKESAERNGFECDFVILKASQFGSGFAKPEFREINIVFETKTERETKKFGDIVSSFEARPQERDDFFYLFYKRKSKGCECLNIQEICKNLLTKLNNL